MDGARWEFLFWGGYGFVLQLTCFCFQRKKRTSSAEVLGNAKDVFITRDLFIKKFLYHFCGTIELKNEAEKASPFGRGGGEADGEGKASPLTRYRGSSPRGRALCDVQLYGGEFCVISDMLYRGKVTLWSR